MSSFELDTSLLARVAERVGAPRAGAVPQQAPRARPAPAAPKAWALPGILGTTRVSTSFGEVPAQLVRVRDRLRTREGGFLPVLRIDEYKLDEEFLAERPDARPVLIARASLDGRLPTADVCLSPGQTLLNPVSGVMLEARAAREVSVRRASLDRAMGQLSYYVFHLAAQADIRAEGIWVRIGAA